MLKRAALLLLLAICAGFFAWQRADVQQPPAKEPFFNSVMPTLIRVDWRDPGSPRYANLGNDQFLFETKYSVQLWDYASNKLSPPTYALPIEGVGIDRRIHWQVPVDQLSHWPTVRLGDAPAGTAVVARIRADTHPVLLWWNGKSRAFAARLPINEEVEFPNLLRLGPRHVLLCGKASAVARLNQTQAGARLEWAAGADAEARQVLERTGVVGTVRGFGSLADLNPALPIYFDTTSCAWAIKNPPAHLKPQLNAPADDRAPRIKPFFLADGRILIAGGNYHDGHYWKGIDPPLLWNAESARWTEIERTGGGRDSDYRAGSEEPVIVRSSGSPIIQFLDSKNMRWSRSLEQVNRNGDGFSHIETLSDGSALVLQVPIFNLSDSGVVGRMTRLHGAMPPGTLSRYREYSGELHFKGGTVMLIGGDHRLEVIDTARKQARRIAPMPEPYLIGPVALELRDGSVLVFGGMPPGCLDSYRVRNGNCTEPRRQPTYRYFVDADKWQRVPAISVPYSREATASWPRNDATVRSNGLVVWIEDEDVAASDEEKGPPQTSKLMLWNPAESNEGARLVAPLRKARTQSTLLQLDDGRLAVIGGKAQVEIVALEKDCLDCPDEFVSLGPFQQARSTEVLDEADPVKPVWKVGPAANYGGGRALKLGNGRIFKLSLAGSGFHDSEGYRAEIADAGLTRWEKLPPFPAAGEIINGNVNVLGNRVVILMENKQTVVWDDHKGKWSIWPEWAKQGGSDPVSIVAAPAPGQALIRYPESFVVVPLPAD
jgi:hypothetical protein